MQPAIDAIRRFNRFFTRHVGAMDARFLGSDANLAEARLLFEIANRAPVEARVLQEALDLDRGYLSRMVARFEARGWIVRARAAGDARARPMRLAPAGEAAFRTIDARQRAAVQADLDALDPVSRADLVQALTRARLLLDPASGGAFTLRALGSGDAGAIASRQALLYAASHGWGRPLEALVLHTVADFLRDLDPARAQGWVAEIDGVMAGAVLLSDEGQGKARLRLLHVEPFARRRGIGEALVRRCVEFATGHGYAEIGLWTHAVLEPARRIYARAGFERVACATHYEFGDAVEGETWRRLLPTGRVQ